MNPIDCIHGRDRIAALIQFMQQQGYSPNHIAAHVRTEWSNHATAGSVDYGKGIAAACKEFFEGIPHVLRD